ncbi:MFS transporter [uncultured Sulfitobacter sp.]|uniref:spinster family MFS transporter n=1 Tax=uncultured Sulfitobacter sp. TaxID=191468 RepID=UPI00262CF5ED|nr:MFS transporter [uncultured Sulfitobacter sp.]
MRGPPSNHRQSGGSSDTWTVYSDKQRRSFLLILFLVSTSNVVDRQILTVLLEPIKVEFGVTDTMLGLLSGLTFAVFYVTLGLPIARLADYANRKLIIGISLTVWSVMTVLCGGAHTFFQLVLARAGVGAGEAGAIPPSQSLLVDYFPPDRRSFALGVFFLSAAAGNVLGLVIGGQVADAFGWRWTFVIFGIPGVFLAFLVWFVLDEPRRLPQFSVNKFKMETFSRAATVLVKKKSFVNSVIGLVLYYTLIYGAQTFSISFVIRTQELSLALASAYVGGVGLVAAILGNLFGGWLADKLSARNEAWLARIPAYGFLIAMPLFLASYMPQSLTTFLILLSLGLFVLMMAAPPLFSCLHAVCGSSRRATAIALAYFFANLFGLGLGPVIAGVLSDYFAKTMGEAEGLRYALATLTILFIPSAVFMLKASKTIANELED